MARLSWLDMMSILASSRKKSGLGFLKEEIKSSISLAASLKRFFDQDRQRLNGAQVEIVGK